MNVASLGMSPFMFFILIKWLFSFCLSVLYPQVPWGNTDGCLLMQWSALRRGLISENQNVIEQLVSMPTLCYKGGNIAQLFANQTSLKSQSGTKNSQFFTYKTCRNVRDMQRIVLRIIFLLLVVILQQPSLPCP